MSVAVSQMPLAPGDFFHRMNAHATTSPINPLAAPFKPTGMYVQTTANDSDTTSSTSARRLSAGAAFAEAVGIDLNAIGRAEARKIMSVEHKVLGFRPPQGSLAAEAQAAAAKHPEVTGVQPPDSEKLKEAAKVDAQRILAERNQASGSGSPTSSAVDKAALTLNDGNAPEVDLSTLSEADARKLMSHEHRALGFRPPPGSLAAEAQAIVAKATEAKPANGTKARRMSNDVKPRRASNDMSPHSRRGSNESIGKPKMRRGSNETTEIRRSNSDESIKAPPKSKETRRKSMNVAGLSLAEKEVLLREVALKDAERIKATRGINGESASENAHVDLSGDKTVTSSPTLPALDHANLPGPVQEAQAAVADLVDPVQPAIDSLTQRVAVAPAEEHVATDLMAEVIPEQDEETFEPTHAPMSRTETGDSVQIVGDVRV